MSYFYPEINHVKNKPVSHHPWEKFIKYNYIDSYKYGHLTANNLIKHPNKKEKSFYPDRVKFTVIGNRLSKDFLYCVKIVKGLHKYRSQHFDVPVIRGVSGVEWPKVWNDLKIQYGNQAYCLQSQVAVLHNDDFLGGEPELKNFVDSKFIYYIRLNYRKEALDQLATFIKSSGRPCAYMHFSVDGEHIGTMIFMLYADIVPRTSENFLRLCTTKKGGYSGTPVHRIVKDCWIQCGGFGLKDTDLGCENFIIPHDTRGVLAMANDGRDVDCSTQFFILLQPAPWMASKYVAFGQLIIGEDTLQKIEDIETYYESPSKKIIIHDAGILNMDCQHIAINKNTNEYLKGHVENLEELGTLLYESLMEKLFLTLELRHLERLRKQMGEEVVDEETVGVDLFKRHLHATARFMRRKDEIDKQLHKTPTEPQRSSVVSGEVPGSARAASAASEIHENNDFDVDEYDYEPEEYSYKQATPIWIPPKPERPFYLPFTDVPYSGEVDSNYDLKKLLKGDYCLESDLDKEVKKEKMQKNKNTHVMFPSELIEVLCATDEVPETTSINSLTSEDEKEITKYLSENSDRISFAGDIIKNMAKKAQATHNIFSNPSYDLTDEQLRKLRVASSASSRPKDLTDGTQKHVLIEAPISAESQTKTKRRPTGFIYADDLKKYRIPEDEDDDDDELTRKVRIASFNMDSSKSRLAHRRRSSLQYDDDTHMRQSVLTRLFDETTVDESGPTLKDFKAMTENINKVSMFLTFSTNLKGGDDDNIGTPGHNKYQRQAPLMKYESLDHVLQLQHGRRIFRKLSSDYVQTIGTIEHQFENSIRSLEYAKTRPAITVADYKLRNQKYQQDLLLKAQLKKENAAKTNNEA